MPKAICTCAACGVTFQRYPSAVGHAKHGALYCSKACRGIGVGTLLSKTPEPEKACTDCGLVKPIADFYKDKRAFDGSTQRCKECTKQRMADYYDENSEAVLQRVTAYSKAHPETQLRYIRKARGSNPNHTQQARARRKVQRAVKMGLLHRPDRCESCGKLNGRIVAHHHRGYDDTNALDVLWVCTPCHLRAHDMVRPRRLAEAKGSPRIDAEIVLVVRRP